jgi:hypothetical protein
MSISSCFKNPHPPSPFPFSVYPHIICQLLFLRFLESTYIQVCFPLLTLFMLFKISKPYVIEFGSILKLNVMGCYVFGHVVESSLDIFTTLDSSTERWLLCTEFTSDIMMVNSLLCRLTFTLFFPGDSEQLQKLEREYYWIMVQVWLLVKLLLLETEFH